MNILEKDKTIKSKRYIGGVCVRLGEKYDIKPMFVRIIFIVSIIILQIIPIVFYISSWIFNSQNFTKVNDKNERNKYQVMGLLLGMIIGTIIGLLFVKLFVYDNSYAAVFFGAIGFVIGAIAGFIIGRKILDNKIKSIK